MDLRTGSSGSVSSRVGVDQVPGHLRALTTIAEPDYIDLYSLQTPRAGSVAPEDWARAVLERAALSRRGARALWRSMGLRLGPSGDPRYVQGWRIAESTDSHIRVETSSWYLRAEAVCAVEGDTVSLTLALQFVYRPAALVAWAAVAVPHQRAVPVMLAQADELLAHDLA